MALRVPVMNTAARAVGDDYDLAHEAEAALRAGVFGEPRIRSGGWMVIGGRSLLGRRDPISARGSRVVACLGLPIQASPTRRPSQQFAEILRRRTNYCAGAARGWKFLSEASSTSSRFL